MYFFSLLIAGSYYMVMYFIPYYFIFLATDLFDNKKIAHNQELFNNSSKILAWMQLQLRIYAANDVFSLGDCNKCNLRELVMEFY